MSAQFRGHGCRLRWRRWRFPGARTRTATLRRRKRCLSLAFLLPPRARFSLTVAHTGLIIAEDEGWQRQRIVTGALDEQGSALVACFRITDEMGQLSVSLGCSGMDGVA